MQEFPRQLLQVPPGFLGQFLIHAVIRGCNVQVDHVEQDDGDAWAAAKSVDAVEHLGVTLGGVNGHEYFFRLHTPTCRHHSAATN